jgi:hypothetical protein
MKQHAVDAQKSSLTKQKHLDSFVACAYQEAARLLQHVFGYLFAASGTAVCATPQGRTCAALNSIKGGVRRRQGRGQGRGHPLLESVAREKSEPLSHPTSHVAKPVRRRGQKDAQPVIHRLLAKRRIDEPVSLQQRQSHATRQARLRVELSRLVVETLRQVQVLYDAIAQLVHYPQVEHGMCVAQIGGDLVVKGSLGLVPM